MRGSATLFYALFVAGASVLPAGCGVLDFDVDQDIPQQTVQGSGLPGIIDLPSFLQVPLQINVQSETQRRNTGPAKSAVLKRLTLAATPAGMPSGNFDFLDEAHIYIEATTGGSLPKKEIATLSPVPKGQTALTFAVAPGVDLLPYSSAGATITSSARGRQPPKEFTFNGHVTITVKF